MPVVGFLYVGSPEPVENRVAAFRKGLSESDFIEGRNVAIEFRWAESHYGRLLELAADLVRRRVDAIVASPEPAALAAKAATTTTPIIFFSGDPIRTGLVASLSRPGGNVTGVATMNNEITAKRLGILRDLIPRETIQSPGDASD